jgi:HK97 family phage prohead protease
MASNSTRSRPYAGKLKFGPERFAEIDEDRQDKVTEKMSKTPERKFLAGTIEKAAGLDDRQIRIKVSTPADDRCGDVMEPEGCVLDNYRNNPIVLASHDPEHPIGTADVTVTPQGLEALITFAAAGISAKADEYCGLAKSGVLRAASIGFDPIEGQPIKATGGTRYTKWELLEMSLVSVPMNAEALTIQRALGATNKKSADWKVGASRNLPVADGDPAWDGDAAKARIFEKAGFDGDSPDSSWARKAFLCYDAAAPNLKGSYKLPFADVVDGRLTVVPAGIRNAASCLPQTDISDDVKEKARAVIDHYEGKMDKSAARPKIKGLYELAELACALEHLGFIQSMAEFEAACEEDNSKLPAMLAAAMAQVAAALVAMSQEETAELLAGTGIEPLPADADYVALGATPQAKALRAVFRKAGRVLSQENMDHVAAIQKCVAAMGECHTKAADLHDDLHDAVAAIAQHIAEIGEHAKAMCESAKDRRNDDGDENADDEQDDDNELAAALAQRKRMIEVMALAPAVVTGAVS